MSPKKARLILVTLKLWFRVMSNMQPVSGMASDPPIVYIVFGNKCIIDSTKPKHKL